MANSDKQFFQSHWSYLKSVIFGYKLKCQKHLDDEVPEGTEETCLGV